MNRLAAEFIGTFWLVFGGCESAVLAAGVPEVGIGLLGVSLAPVSNTSVNPARSTATALFADTAALSQLWAFWVAPLAAAALGALIHRLISLPEPRGVTA